MSEYLQLDSDLSYSQYKKNNSFEKTQWNLTIKSQ